MRNLLDQIAPPSLPNSPVDYSAAREEHYSRVLRLYFARLNHLLSNVIGERGTQYLDAPYAAYSYILDVVAGAANTAYDIPLAVANEENGTTLVSSKYIAVQQNGLYNLQFSIQFSNSDANDQDITVWLRKNGANVSATSSLFSVPGKHGSIEGKLVGAANFFIELNAGDTVSMAWATENVAAYLHTHAASSVAPLSPAVVMTLTYVSNLKA